MEGTRPVLVEIQALVAPSALGTPRRAVIGWDQPRLAMVLAVLEAHCGVRLGQHDVYLNVAGGFRISEPAADLAVAAALVSSLSGRAAAARLRLFRRGQPVGRRAPGRPCRAAPEGGGKARLPPGGPAVGEGRDSALAGDADARGRAASRSRRPRRCWRPTARGLIFRRLSSVKIPAEALCQRHTDAAAART